MRSWLARIGPVAEEGGELLVEVLIASTVLTIVLSMVFVSTGTMTKVTGTQVRRGSLTGAAAVGAAAVEQLITNAWTPESPNAVGITDDCAGGGDGQTFPSAQGPFVEASGIDLWFCAIRPGQSTAYTYELHFTGCSAAAVCTLRADRQPSPGASGQPVSILAVGDASCPACLGAAGATSPFVYVDDSTGSDTVLNPGGGAAAVPGASLVRIDLVDLTLTVTDAATGTAASTTTVQQSVALPNTEGGV